MKSIWDLSQLNTFLEMEDSPREGFKMEMAEIRQLIKQGEWVISLDFTGARMHTSMCCSTRATRILQVLYRQQDVAIPGSANGSVFLTKDLQQSDQIYQVV